MKHSTRTAIEDGLGWIVWIGGGITLFALLINAI